MLQQQPADISPGLIQEALEAILASPAFRASRQCRQLLSYIVARSLAHEDDLLRERVIGAAVFGRSPDYDAGNDPIVRSRVAEVRKRLAQFYLGHRSEVDVHVAIPSGSYKAIFLVETRTATSDHVDSLSALPAETPTGMEVIEAVDPPVLPEVLTVGGKMRGHRAMWGMGLAVLLLVGLCGAALFWTRHARQDAVLFRTFWRPMAANGKSTVIYIGANYAYRLSPSYLDAYRKEHKLKNEGPEFFIDLKSTDSLPAKDLLPTNNFIGFGDVAATSRVIAALTLLGDRYDLRYGDDLSVTDLQSSPVILVGGFSNPWTMKLTSGLRYTLDQGDRVIDTQDHGRVFRVGEQSDYAVVSRIPHSPTGNLVIAIAGVGTSANQAAADFISDPQRLNSLLRKAPSGWANKNFQLLLRTSIISDIPVSVEVVAVSFG